MLLAKLVPVSKRITSVGRANDSMQEGRYTLSLVYLGLRCVLRIYLCFSNLFVCMTSLDSF